MKYIGLNKTEITYGSIVHVRRDLCFTLLAPGEFDTHEFIQILFERAGAIIETVEIFNVYHNPETGEVAHTYHLTFRCNNTGSKAGYGYPVEFLNALMHEIELECETRMAVKVSNYHTVRENMKNPVKTHIPDERK
jgi:hypothetical protein